MSISGNYNKEKLNLIKKTIVSCSAFVNSINSADIATSAGSIGSAGSTYTEIGRAVGKFEETPVKTTPTKKELHHVLLDNIDLVEPAIKGDIPTETPEDVDNDAESDVTEETPVDNSTENNVTEETPTDNTDTVSTTTDAEPEVQAPGQSDVPNKSEEINVVLSEILAVIADVRSDIRNIKDLSNVGDNMHTEFGLDANGKIIFQDKNTSALYDELMLTIKNKLNAKDTELIHNIGEDNLEKIVQAAWLMAYNNFDSSKKNNTNEFLKTVINNVQKLFKQASTSEEILTIITERPSYADNKVVDGVTHYGTKTTAGNDETVIYKGDVVVYDDGTIHLNSTADDKDYQSTMKDVLGKLFEKYPNADKDTLIKLFRQAQQNALKALQSNAYDCPYGTGNNNSRVGDETLNWGGKDNRKDDKGKIHMDQLVQMTLYQFDKLMYDAVASHGVDIMAKSDNTAEPNDKVETKAPEVKYQEEAKILGDAIENVFENLGRDEYKFSKIAGDKLNAQVRLKDGVLVNTDTSANKLRCALIDKIYAEISGNIDKIGGKPLIGTLVDRAWIAAIGSSTQNVDTDTFAKEILNNIEKMVDDIGKDASMLGFYNTVPSYSDKSLTTDLPHYGTKTTYGNDQTINYKGNVSVYADGTVHLDSTQDDKDYQTTMNALLDRLIAKYPNVGKDKVVELFRQAQQNALKAMQSNSTDIPYGTDNKNGSRKGDGSKINMNQLVDITLYHFDKLLLNYAI